MCGEGGELAGASAEAQNARRREAAKEMDEGFVCGGEEGRVSELGGLVGEAGEVQGDGGAGGGGVDFKMCHVLLSVGAGEGVGGCCGGEGGEEATAIHGEDSILAPEGRSGWLSVGASLYRKFQECTVAFTYKRRLGCLGAHVRGFRVPWRFRIADCDLALTTEEVDRIFAPHQGSAKKG